MYITENTGRMTILSVVHKTIIRMYAKLVLPAYSRWHSASEPCKNYSSCSINPRLYVSRKFHGLE